MKKKTFGNIISPTKFWNWIPQTQYGPFSCEETLSNDQFEEFALKEIIENESDDIKTYKTNIDGLSVTFFDDGTIGSIYCAKEFWLEDNNLIGYSIYKLQDLLGFEADELNISIGVLNYSSLGLLFLLNGSLIVKEISVTLSAKEEE